MARKFNYGVGKTLDDKTLAARSLIGIFNKNIRQIKQGRVFVHNSKAITVTALDWGLDNMLLENYGRFYKSTKWTRVVLQLRWAAKEMIWEEIDMEYPEMSLNDWEDITKYFKDNVIMRWLVKDKLIDDEMLAVMKGVFDRFYFIYDPTINLVGMCLKKMTREVWIEIEALLDKEIELWYVNNKIWDEKRKRGYTHILRRNLELRFQTWQKTMLFNWKKFNFIAWSRRIWKTYTSAYIAYRELYRIWGWYGKRERQILYICVSEDKMWQPMQYMAQMVKKDISLGYIKKTWTEFHNLITGAKLIFRTANSRTWAASYGADLVILDEWAMISDEFWEDLLPIIMQEKATVFAISTINEDVKSWWFYDGLLRWELGDDENYNCIRVTIDDNELLTHEDREATKDALRHNAMKYWTQLYSIFPSGNNVFKLTWVIQPEEYVKPNYVIIWYDPWKIKDDAALVVMDIDRVRIIDAIALMNMDYMDQKLEIIELKKKYNKSIVIMDRTWVWEAVREIMRDVIDTSVKYKGRWEITHNDRFSYYNVSKSELVSITNVAINNVWLSIDSNLLQLITQLKGFKKINAWTVTQYEWEGVKDDLTNAMMLACFYAIKVLGIRWKNEASSFQVIDKYLSNEMDFMFEDDSSDKLLNKYIY